ncbi:pyridoxal-dependent decarboxylase domain protein [Cadophora sp. DSE1049]|nr:pyridoxal-dependent decarboxylase domain protein [Cadophora sp. DSE1049]
MASTEAPVQASGVLEDKSHQAISSYFIGPQAENLGDFKDNIDSILNELQKARANYFPEDGVFISNTTRDSQTFQACKKRVSNAVTKAAHLLGKHSLPFWSPRYQAHMCMDMSMPALLGYFMTMIYNPNNVAIEASPLTTVAEIEAGEQLCQMFGYNLDTAKLNQPVGWGHITCGGTGWYEKYKSSADYAITNLDLTPARNLKFYPFSIFKALQPNGLLQFVADSFQIDNCVLSNLKPKDVLDIPDRLAREYGVSPKYMEKVLLEYSIQQTGKDVLEREFELKPPQYFLSNTRHYSWPKGAAIVGIGAQHVIGVPVDHGARLRLDKLEELLEQSLANKQGVYAVVAIIGSTEEGCVDRLSEVLAMRKKFQARGLSFLVHADAAWGGYFASMLPIEYQPGDNAKLTIGDADAQVGEGAVPDSALRTETQEDLFALRFADSITVDPHKAGYIPYPAGGLCYRDERMRYLVTWTSPYLSRGAVTSMGIYGVEGSKPGAAAMSTWLSNKCIGMGPEGYGALLGEVTFTCSRFAAEWAAMTALDKDDFRVVPLNMLPSEFKPGSNTAKVEEEKQRIRDTILSKSNAQILASDVGKPEEEKALTLLRALGSDLNINAFSLNFRLTQGKDGAWNTDVEEANYLMRRVVERLSVDSPEDGPSTIPFVLTSTEFSKELYDECATNFKRRLGLRKDDLDLMVLRNVVMNPFPTERNFIGNLAQIFRGVVEEEVKVCQQRNSAAPTNHEFLLQGRDRLFMLHVPSFHIANHRQQLIVEIELDAKSKREYLLLKNASPGDQLTLVTQVPIQLPKLLKPNSHFKASIRSKDAGLVLKNITVTIKHVIKSRPLNPAYLDPSYPATFMPLYLYGTSTEQHIDHMLLRAPNSQFSAESIKLELDKPLTDEQLARGPILCLRNVHEESMQPFPLNSELDASSSFLFKPGRKISVLIFADEHDATAHGPGLASSCGKEELLLATGTVTLGKSVVVDSETMNTDPFKRMERVVRWREEFDKIGRSMDD